MLSQLTVIDPNSRDGSEVRGQRSSLTQEVLVRAEFGRVQKKLNEDVAGDDQNQRDSQQSRDHAVEEQPAGHTEYTLYTEYC